MEIIVTEISEGIGYYQELHDWAKSFDYDPDDENFDALSMMDGDPDKLKCGDRELFFIDVELADKKFILTSSEITSDEKEMLRAFHSDEFHKSFTSAISSWKVFDSLKNAIAYRGGSGYVYSIWNYTPCIEV